jgi:ribonuclease P protein component
MLPKAHRLNSQEVESAVKVGRRASTGLFSLHIVPSSIPKIAVIIPKKVAKTSVLRHKHKRRIVNALMKFPIPAAHIVITLRQDISKLGFKELCDHISDRIAQ